MNISFIWIGLGITLGIIGIIYFSIKTGKKRAREVEELNQHFPEATSQPITVEKMRNKRKRSQKPEMDVETGIEREIEEDKGKLEEEVVEGSPEDAQTINSEHVEHPDDLERPVRYKRSIFHPDHLKQESDEPKDQ